MKQKPLILITNDDGFRAKGINELIKALRGRGELIVFAPDGPRSGMSSAITSLTPLKYDTVLQEDDLTIFSCNGTPVDCVKLAINEVLDREPDLLVSGINHGGNMAICVNYSATMGAAAEGCIFGIPSIGLSVLDHRPDADFRECCRLGIKVIDDVLAHGLPHGTYLNLNVPVVERVKGLKVCHQADGRWIKEFKRSENASGHPVFWLTGEFRNDDTRADNDMLALDNGFATLVPCKVDVTDYQFLKELRKRTEE